MTLPRYVSWRFLVAIFRVLVVIALLLMVVEILESFRRTAGKDGGFQVVFMLAILRLPAMIEQVMSIIILIASLSLFIGLARSSEMVILRASGVSAIRVVAVPAVVAFLIGLGSIFVLNPIVASTTSGYAQLNDEISAGPARVSVSDEGVWLRQVADRRHMVIQAARVLPEGPTLIDATMHIFNADNRLISRVQAGQAILGAREWRLIDVREWDVAQGPTDAPGKMRILEQTTLPTNLSAEQILDSFAPPEEISFWDMPRFIQQLERSGFTAIRHKQYFQTLLATPILMVSMVLIGAALTMRHARMAQVGVAVVTTVLAGFSLYFLRDISASFGAAGEVPVMIAAWAPPLAAAMAAFGLLLHLEDG